MCFSIFSEEANIDWKPYIDVDPKILRGEPHIKGTRISVGVVLQNLATGLTEEEIIESYPSLNKKAIHAAVTYAEELVRDVDGKL